MNKILFAVAAIGGMLAAQSTLAADLGGYNAAPTYNAMTYGTSVADWSGFYAGANVGYGWGKADTNLAPPNTFNTGGFNGGVQAGYNFQAGDLVFGVEADAQLANIYYSQNLAGGAKSKVGVDAFGTLRGRVGYSFDAFMPYATAGLAVGRGTASYTNGAGVETANSQTHVGWTLGAGVEVAVTDQITAKAEYLYTNLGTQPYAAGYPTGGANTNLDFGTIRFGVNYKF